MRRLVVHEVTGPPLRGVSGDRVFCRRGECTFLKVVSVGVIGNVFEAAALASIIFR